MTRRQSGCVGSRVCSVKRTWMRSLPCFRRARASKVAERSCASGAVTHSSSLTSAAEAAAGKPSRNAITIGSTQAMTLD
jgi:hypothetical protein